MPDLKAELLEGVLYLASPIRNRQHGRPHAILAGWPHDHCRATPGVECTIDASARLDLDSEP